MFKCTVYYQFLKVFDLINYLSLKFLKKQKISQVLIAAGFCILKKSTTTSFFFSLFSGLCLATHPKCIGCFGNGNLVWTPLHPWSKDLMLIWRKNGLHFIFSFIHFIHFELLYLKKEICFNNVKTWIKMEIPIWKCVCMQLWHAWWSWIYRCDHTFYFSL